VLCGRRSGLCNVRAVLVRDMFARDLEEMANQIMARNFESYDICLLKFRENVRNMRSVSPSTREEANALFYSKVREIIAPQPEQDDPKVVGQIFVITDDELTRVRNITIGNQMEEAKGKICGLETKVGVLEESLESTRKLLGLRNGEIAILEKTNKKLTDDLTSANQENDALMREMKQAESRAKAAEEHSNCLVGRNKDLQDTSAQATLENAVLRARLQGAGRLEWVQASNGNVPANAVSSGGIDLEDKERHMYVGRGWNALDGWCPGKVHTRHECLYYPCRGEIKAKTYECLTFKPA